MASATTFTEVANSLGAKFNYKVMNRLKAMDDLWAEVNSALGTVAPNLTAVTKEQATATIVAALVNNME